MSGGVDGCVDGGVDGGSGADTSGRVVVGSEAVRLRAQLGAVGAVLGVPLIVTDDADWRLDLDGLRVGLGWYAARGHSETESVALALLQVWEGVRAVREAPERARRRRTLGRAMPEAAPLLDAVLRLQCAAELLTALPAVRGHLAAALHRSLPVSLEELPRHLQWVVLILSAGLPSGGIAAHATTVDATVAAEWRALAERVGGSASVPDLLRRVLVPDPAYTPLQRFARALALLLPPYERLLALDARERGLTDERRVSADGQDDATVESGLELGAETGPDSDEEGDGPGEPLGPEDTGTEETGTDEGGSADDSTPAAGESDRARAGEGRDTAEGADLFAAEHAAFVEKILATPMPAEGALFESVMDLTEMPHGSHRSDPNALAPGAAATAAAGRTALTTYRARADALAAPIERMREVWARVIAERVARRPRMGRRAEPEGDELAQESLAAAVAESLAGAVRPNAYRRREALPRRVRRAGSTDYVLLIDRSASMSGRPAECAADAAVIMLEALAGVERDVAHAESQARTPLELDIRTSLIVFDAEAHVVKPLSGGVDDAVRRELHAAIRAPRGATNDGAALAAAADQLGIGRDRAHPAGDGLERRRIVILVGDGGTNDPAAADYELRRLRRAGASVHGIGLGSDEIVQRYAPTSRRLDDPREIAAALQSLVEEELP